MSEEQTQIKHWQGLKQQAVDGDLRMDEDLGTALRDACEKYRQALMDQKDQARNLGRLAGYGGLPSAKHLQQKFEQKATGGGGAGPDDNAIARLDEHIQIAELMRDTYAAAIGKLQQTDQDNAAGVNNAGEGMR